MLNKEEQIDEFWKTKESLSYEDFIDFLADQEKFTIQEMIKLSDKIEMQEPDGGTRQWKAFKCFRNTMRYKLNNPTK